MGTCVPEKSPIRRKTMCSANSPTECVDIVLAPTPALISAAALADESAATDDQRKGKVRTASGHAARPRHHQLELALVFARSRLPNHQQQGKNCQGKGCSQKVKKYRSEITRCKRGKRMSVMPMLSSADMAKMYPIVSVL